MGWSIWIFRVLGNDALYSSLFLSAACAFSLMLMRAFSRRSGQVKVGALEGSYPSRWPWRRVVGLV